MGLQAGHAELQAGHMGLQAGHMGLQALSYGVAAAAGGGASEAGMLSSVAMKPMRMRVYGLITLRSTCVRMFLRRSSMYSLMKGSPGEGEG